METVYKNNALIAIDGTECSSEEEIKLVNEQFWNDAIINQFLALFKEKLHDLLEFFINNSSKNRYVDLFTSLQDFSNSFLISFLINYFD